ncbi:hypothetical protein [Bacteroides neonati]|nr:hypothetical protein [Bacteroides neonati]
MEDKTFIQLGATMVFVVAIVARFSKKEDACLCTILLCILGYLMLIYSKL